MSLLLRNLTVLLLTASQAFSQSSSYGWEQFAKAGDFQKAEEYVNLQLSASPPDYHALWSYVHYLHNEASRDEDVIRITDLWLANLRRDKPARFGVILKERGIAQIVVEYGKRPEVASLAAAKKTLTEAIIVNSNVSEAYVYLSAISAREGNADRALQWLQLAVEKSTDPESTKKMEEFTAIAKKDANVLVGFLNSVAGVAH